MSRAAVLLALSVLLCSCGVRTDEMPANQKPLFGGTDRRAAELTEDVKEAEEAAREAGGPRPGAEKLLNEGWQYERRGYWDIAMVRFNQAWLLDPENPDSFFGMADSLVNQDRFEEAAALFERVLRTPRGQSLRLCMLARRFQNQDPRRYLELALKLYDLAARSTTDDAELDQIYYQWAIGLAVKRDYAGAWEKVRESQRHGGKAVEPGFLETLTRDRPPPSA